MKIAELENNGEIIVKQRTKPLIKKNLCLIKVKYCGICSTDIYRAYGNGAYDYPLVMGHEISGIIEDIGTDCDNFTLGDKVSVFPLLPCFECEQCRKDNYVLCFNYSYYGSRCDGGYSEYLLANPWNLMKIPDQIELKDACFLEPTAVIVHATKITNALNLNNKNILIIGAGFLGLLLSELLYKNTTNRVSVFDVNEFKFSRLPDNITTFTSERLLTKDSYDLVFECTGSESGFNTSLNAVNRNGNICIIGNPVRPISVSQYNYSKILRKEVSIKGSWNSSYKKAGNDDWIFAREALLEGLSPSKYVSHEIKLDELGNFLFKCWNHKNKNKIFKHVKGVVKL